MIGNKGMKTYGYRKVTKPKKIAPNDTPCVVCQRVEQYPHQDGTWYICGSCVARAGGSVNFETILERRQK